MVPTIDVFHLKMVFLQRNSYYIRRWPIEPSLLTEFNRPESSVHCFPSRLHPSSSSLPCDPSSRWGGSPGSRPHFWPRRSSPFGQPHTRGVTVPTQWRICPWMTPTDSLVCEVPRTKTLPSYRHRRTSTGPSIRSGSTSKMSNTEILD